MPRLLAPQGSACAAVQRVGWKAAPARDMVASCAACQGLQVCRISGLRGGCSKKEGCAQLD